MLFKSINKAKADLHDFCYTFNQSLISIGIKNENKEIVFAHGSSDIAKCIVILILTLHYNT